MSADARHLQDMLWVPSEAGLKGLKVFFTAQVFQWIYPGCSVKYQEKSEHPYPPASKAGLYCLSTHYKTALPAQGTPNHQAQGASVMSQITTPRQHFFHFFLVSKMSIFTTHTIHNVGSFAGLQSTEISMAIGTGTIWEGPPFSDDIHCFPLKFLGG